MSRARWLRVGVCLERAVPRRLRHNRPSPAAPRAWSASRSEPLPPKRGAGGRGPSAQQAEPSVRRPPIPSSVRLHSSCVWRMPAADTGLAGVGATGRTDGGDPRVVASSGSLEPRIDVRLIDCCGCVRIGLQIASANATDRIAVQPPVRQPCRFPPTSHCGRSARFDRPLDTRASGRGGQTAYRVLRAPTPARRTPPGDETGRSLPHARRPFSPDGWRHEYCDRCRRAHCHRASLLRPARRAGGRSFDLTLRGPVCGRCGCRRRR
jgi:hypothetical protein